MQHTALSNTIHQSARLGNLEYLFGTTPTGAAFVHIIQHTPKAKYTPFKYLAARTYQTLEAAEKAFTNTLAAAKALLQKREDAKAAKRAALAQIKAADFYKEGDIIVNTWGWEQTNVSFYRVQKVTNRTIQIEELEPNLREVCSAMSDSVVPSDTLREKGESYSLRVGTDGRLSGGESFFYFHKWNGKPQFRSWYA